MEMQLVAAPHRPERAARHWLAVLVSSFVGAALVAAFVASGAHQHVTGLLAGAPPIVPGTGEGVTITTEDVDAANAKVVKELGKMKTVEVGSIRGSQPTDEVEAKAIIGDMNHYVRTMGDEFYPVTGPHNDITKEADAIIDASNRDNMDITGKAGAEIYEVASDPSAPGSAWLRGSIPNYNAESTYIISGVDGNYEKELENAPTMKVVGGKVPAREVAAEIVDDAYRDPTSPDCTGSVDGDGIHGVGHGTPPCSKMLKFRRPKTMAPSDPRLSKIYVNISMPFLTCSEEAKEAVRHAIAEAADAAVADVVFPADLEEAEGEGSGEGSGEGAQALFDALKPTQAMILASSSDLTLEEVDTFLTHVLEAHEHRKHDESTPQQQGGGKHAARSGSATVSSVSDVDRSKSEPIEAKKRLSRANSSSAAKMEPSLANLQGRRGSV